VKTGLLLASLVAGILLAARLPAAMWPVLLSPLLLIPAWPLLRHWQNGWPSLIGACFCIGVALAYLQLHGTPLQPRVSDLAGEESTRLTATITRIERSGDGSAILDLDAVQTFHGHTGRRHAGRLRLFVKRTDNTWRPGDDLQLSARIDIPANYGLPGEFDRPLALAAQGIEATAYLHDDRGIVRLALPGGTKIPLRPEVRRRVADSLGATLSPRRSALLRTLLLGERSALDDADRQLVSRAGIAHLFSVSGLHLGLLSTLLYLLLELIYKRSRRLSEWQPPGRVIPLLILPALWAYVQFTGAGYPVQRAFLMLSGGILLYLWRRATHPLALLQGALLLLLLVQPLSLFSPALQLSAAGLAGILILVPRWQLLVEDRPKWIRIPVNALLVSLAGSLFTFPLVWQYFHVISPAGPWLNLLAVPVIGLLALPAGLLALLLMPLSDTLATLLLQVSGWLVELVLDVSRTLMNWPGFGGMESFPDPLQLTGAWLLIIAALCLTPGAPACRLRVITPLSIGLVCLLVPYPQPASARITALSVGQGEALLLRFSGRNYLLDGGGRYDRSFDVGARLLAPALGRLGVHHLDGVILSHDHPDHRLGLLYLLQHLPVAAFYSAIPRDQLDAELAQVLARHPEIRTETLPEGWSTPVDGDWKLQLWAPPQRATDINDRSLVALLHNGDQGALLTGDLAAPGLALLGRETLPCPVTLFKLPHHGSRHSDPVSLLERWRPPLAFVSVGRHNRFGFPHSEIRDNCKRLGITLLRTDRDGTLQFSAEASGWIASTYANRLFH